MPVISDGKTTRSGMQRVCDLFGRKKNRGRFVPPPVKGTLDGYFVVKVMTSLSATPPLPSSAMTFQ